MRILECQLACDVVDVLHWHLVALVGHEPSLIVLLTSDLPDDIQEWGQLLASALHGCLYAQNRRVRLNVHKSFEHEVLALVDKALLDLLNFPFVAITRLEELNVLSCSNLSLLLNLLPLE